MGQRGTTVPWPYEAQPTSHHDHLHVRAGVDNLQCQSFHLCQPVIRILRKYNSLFQSRYYTSWLSLFPDASHDHFKALLWVQHKPRLFVYEKHKDIVNEFNRHIIECKHHAGPQRPRRSIRTLIILDPQTTTNYTKPLEIPVPKIYPSCSLLVCIESSFHISYSPTWASRVPVSPPSRPASVKSWGNSSAYPPRRSLYATRR
jgi:hypothetical protein